MLIRWGVAVLAVAMAVGCGSSESDPKGGAAGSSGTEGRGEGGTGGGDGTGGTVGGVDDGGQGAEAGATSACACDDGVDCTRDECSDGECRHTALHFKCLSGQYCAGARGCVAGDACADDEDCERPDNCVTASCDPATKRCLFAFLDGDRDGVAPVSCGGLDCNDAAPSVFGGASEICDGKDNDCDGQIDPRAGSGCGAGKSCIATYCICDAPKIECASAGGACVDVENDPNNCGNCDNRCLDTEQCQSGKCQCNPGLARCGGECVELKSDSRNCGECGLTCGNGTCSDGGCVCPAGTEDCSQNDVLDCKATQTDFFNCGECGAACLTAGKCSAGGCDSSVEWIKLYGSYSSHHYYHTAPMDADASGNSFVGFSGEVGSYALLPDGQATLWASRNVLAKFDATGGFAWVKPSDVSFKDVAVMGSDVWALAFVIFDGAPVTIAGQVFTQRVGYEAATVLVKLKGSDGSVLEHVQLDHSKWNTGNEPFLVHDASTLWVGGNTTDITVGETASTPPSNAYSGYLYPLGGTPRWLPGGLLTAVLDGNGKLVVVVNPPYSATFTFGGETFTTTGVNMGYGVARYTNTLQHELSFLGIFDGLPVAGTGPLTLMDGYLNPLFRRLSETGQVTSSTGGMNVPFRAYAARTKNGRIFMFGNGPGSNVNASYEGRDFGWGYPGLVMSFDETSLALKSALAFRAELYSSYGYGRIDDMAFVDGGSSVLLSVLFDGGVAIGPLAVDAGNGYQGLALVKVKL